MGKEQYFTVENISAKVRQLVGRGAQRRNGRDLALVTATSALIVVDMQRYFLDDSSHAFVPSSPAIVPHVSALVESYGGAGRPIIFTRHGNTSQDAGMLAKWWRDVIRVDDPTSEIISALDTSSAMILDKTQYDAFYKTQLEDVLRERDVTQVVVCGVVTNLCCETTARSAFVRGFEVFFAADATAAYDSEQHRSTIINLSHGFATISLTSELLGAMEGDGDD